MTCIFCDIVNQYSPAHRIWEDAHHLAILSIFPNTRGFSVVLPKKHHGSYAFEADDAVLSSLVLASKKVALLLDKAFDDVGRTGMILEGFGVDHLHAKLFPMHGTSQLTTWRPIKSKVDKFFDKYEGYISSHDHLRANDEELHELAARIRAADTKI